MAIKKSPLYSSIWQGCDELRGGYGCLAVQGLLDALIKEVKKLELSGLIQPPASRHLQEEFKALKVTP